jgi:hypothetical protein
MDLEKLTKLLRQVAAAPAGSAKLDLDIVRTFPSAPVNVSRSIYGVMQLIETELPGWWWTCGYCSWGDTASLYPPGSDQFPYLSSDPDFRPRPEELRLIYHPKWGQIFDRGFHCDMGTGSLPLSMLIVFLRAKIALAKAALSTDPKRKREEQREAIRKFEEEKRKREEQREAIRKYEQEERKLFRVRDKKARAWMIS